MQFEILIDYLNKFAREDTFLSILILAILGNLLTDFSKKILFYIAISTKNITNSTSKNISKWNRKNIEFLIKTYKEDLVEVEMVKNKDQDTYFKLLYQVYNNLLIFFMILILYFIALKIDNPILFYVILGSTSKLLISIFYSFYYNTTLFENAQDFDNYKLKKEKRIKLLEKLIEN